MAVPATVPGDAHVDLVDAGIVGEPYASNNTDISAWVHNTTWIWDTAFETPATFADYSNVELVCDGLDTVASVEINGVLIVSSANAFTRLVRQLTSLQPPGASNTLRVTIASPVQYALNQSATCEGWCPSIGSDGFSNSSLPGFTYIRKPAVSFGWDFAPPLPAMGIWRPIYLRAYNTAVIDEVTVVTTPVSGGANVTGVAWTANFTAFVPAVADCTGYVTVLVTDPITGLVTESTTPVQLQPGPNGLVLPVTVPNVSQWWPVNLGAQTLYNVSITLNVSAVRNPQYFEVSAYSLRTGFRTVTMDMPPSPSGTGTLLYFAINDTPIWIKGANWVPIDAFAARGERLETVEARQRGFMAAGWNALRVWGGGYPPASSFYDMADQLGLLIWQEAPFACQKYPAGPAFLTSVSTETVDIVKRIAKHPSLFLWGGNNEVGQINPAAPGTPQAGNYSALFFGAVGDSIREIDPPSSRPYRVTSPGSGTETPAVPIADPPQGPTAGDMHVYEYSCNCWDFTSYPKSRLASEYGWQSWSSLISFAEVLTPSTWSYWNGVFLRRDTHQSQPAPLILYKNIGQNWLIPGFEGAGHSKPGDRDNRLSGTALQLATAARAANQTSTAYNQRSDGAFELPTDALGVVPMMSSFNGVGEVNGTAFRDVLWASQMAHATCMKTESEHYRRLQSQCDDDNGGCTSGSLFWMAADIWPAATKGAVEWNGRMKASYYSTKKSYAPFFVGAWAGIVDANHSVTDATFGIHVAAHPPASNQPLTSGSHVVLQCWSWKDGLIGTASYPITLPPSPDGQSGAVEWPSGPAGGSLLVTPVDMKLDAAIGACGGAGYAAADLVLNAQFINGSGSGDDGSVLASNHLFIWPLRSAVGMRDPGLTITNVVDTGTAPGSNYQTFNVSITAAALPVAAVWIESLLCCGWWSDNGFLTTSNTVTLSYTHFGETRPAPWSTSPSSNSTAITAGQLAASLSLWSLWDTAPYG